MPPRARAALFALALATASAAGCRARPSPAAVDAAGPRELSVRVPGALMIARGLDSVLVSLDLAALADTKIVTAQGMTLGVETECFVFPMGRPRPARGRRGLVAGTDFELGTSTWTADRDGIPAQGTRYVAEMTLVLFETNVPAGPHWDPHAGTFNALWSATLHQAEE
jgi:hypothetical protein